MAVNIHPCEAGHEWHPDVGITWRKFFPEVIRFILAQPHSLGIEGFIKWVLIFFLRVEIDNSQPWSLSSEGEADQFTLSEMHPDDETTPFISSNMRYVPSLIELHSVGAPMGVQDDSVSSNELIEIQSHIARDDLYKKNQKHTHNALVKIATKTKGKTIRRFT